MPLPICALLIFDLCIKLCKNKMFDHVTYYRLLPRKQMKLNGLEHLTLIDIIGQGEIDNSLNAFTQPLIKNYLE
jgi:hypothetical protein